jgi:molybdopterin/thiamine biosynthesis adenylyltransferase
MNIKQKRNEDFMAKERYLKNMNLLSAEENDRLQFFKVCVVGCGGLGGYVIELLGRLGVGLITAVDGDVFDWSNLNRQLLSDESLIGQSKALTAVSRMAKVNSDVQVIPQYTFMTEENCDDIIMGHDIVVDALDNMSSRRMLENHCSKCGIPMVHGAIGGWYAQVCTIFPGDHIFSRIYPEGTDRGIEVELGNPSFTPAMTAAIEVSEVVKVLFGKGDILRHKLLTINLLNHEYEIFEL